MLNLRCLSGLFAVILCLNFCRGATASGPIYPRDPPVTENGEGLYAGLSGNDWLDFPNLKLIPHDPVGLLKRGDTFRLVSIPYFREPTDNYLFNYEENKTSAGTGLEHFCPRVDFDNLRFPGDNQIQDANNYWVWFYEGYVPAIQPSVTPPVGPFQQNRATTRNNCVSFAFNGYASGNTRVGWWLQDEQALGLLRGELYAIWDLNHGNTGPVWYGDRCITSDSRADSITTPHGEGSDQTWYPWNGFHAWWVNDENTDGTAASQHIIWKNCTSQIFEWNHTQHGNCAPFPIDTYQGSTLRDLYRNEFEIWRHYEYD